jgi:hypothetical protein
VTPVLHIFCWLWKGWRAIYDRRDVAFLARQLIAHGDLPKATRLVCLTDRPTDWDKPKVEALGVLELPLWPELPGLNLGHPKLPMYPWLPAFKGRPNCYRRLKLFDPEVQAELGVKPGDIIMSMDLDSVVMGSIQALLAPMYNQVNPPDFMAMRGRVSRIHGSLFAFRAGTCAHVWRDFDPKTTPAMLRNPGIGRPRHVGSDQAWLSTVMPEVPLWDTTHGVYSMGIHQHTLRPGDPVTYVSFAGSNKPRDAQCAIHLPWIHTHAMKHWEP